MPSILDNHRSNSDIKSTKIKHLQGHEATESKTNKFL